MTTSHSPLRVLKAQADKIAQSLKAADRGEKIATDPTGKIAASQRKGFIKLAVVMDDKTLVIDMSWEKIHGTSEVGIAEYILALMKGSRETQH